MPYRFMQVPSTASTKVLAQQLNRIIETIDQESYTKDITTGGKRRMTSGKLANSKYGMVFYDASGRPSIRIGQSPKSGRMGIWVAKQGYNVDDEIDR